MDWTTANEFIVNSGLASFMQMRRDITVVNFVRFSIDFTKPRTSNLSIQLLEVTCKAICPESNRLLDHDMVRLTDSLLIAK